MRGNPREDGKKRPQMHVPEERGWGGGSGPTFMMPAAGAALARPGGSLSAELSRLLQVEPPEAGRRGLSWLPASGGGGGPGRGEPGGRTPGVPSAIPPRGSQQPHRPGPAELLSACPSGRPACVRLRRPAPLPALRLASARRGRKGGREDGGTRPAGGRASRETPPPPPPGGGGMVGRPGRGQAEHSPPPSPNLGAAPCLCATPGGGPPLSRRASACKGCAPSAHGSGPARERLLDPASELTAGSAARGTAAGRNALERG